MYKFNGKFYNENDKAGLIDALIAEQKRQDSISKELKSEIIENKNAFEVDSNDIENILSDFFEQDKQSSRFLVFSKMMQHFRKKLVAQTDKIIKKFNKMIEKYSKSGDLKIFIKYYEKAIKKSNKANFAEVKAVFKILEGIKDYIDKNIKNEFIMFFDSMLDSLKEGDKQSELIIKTLEKRKNQELDNDEREDD